MATIQVRRGTTAQWQATSRVLADGEFGFDTDLRLLKLGDGVSSWGSLPSVSFTAP
jgi:hypothetical protein